ncbi:hypothetical protein OPT61_g9285 [Boeremia exigua]|uniref:Uncharacterized protein n=1 Tax=Boeremia exigua TaxID=749465 RepID=A0ACC2HV43_9PLEO|nr:hypothetical protein OPT61_g9285 [Boeremia exigua]
MPAGSSLRQNLIVRVREPCKTPASNTTSDLVAACADIDTVPAGSMVSDCSRVAERGEDREAETLADVAQLSNRGDSPTFSTHCGLQRLDSGRHFTDPCCHGPTFTQSSERRADPTRSCTDTISNVKESKYKCPGCSARTCSLPCVKRHKQWAQCSGKRDPTKYIKKSELATPAGIDHDYNFLSGIERDLEKSEKSVTEKGLDVKLKAKPQGDQTQALENHLAAAGIKIIRAPKGMSRSKENKTHRSKSGNKNVIWTVEWIAADKTRTLTQSSAVEPVYRLHPLHESPLAKKKRKLEAETSTPTNPGVHQDVAGSQEAQIMPVPAESNAEPSKLSPSISTSPATKQSTASTKAQPDAAKGGSSTEERFDFYLLRPRTSSSRRVLIPLTSSDTLGDALRGCTIEEFPTIYYFLPATPKLPDGFMLDEDYRKEEGEQQKEFEELMRDVDPEILRRLRDNGSSSNVDEEVNSKKILDVLKQDLGGL